jgi:molybdopterin-guanine dinucleotide biosynthesis protein A
MLAGLVIAGGRSRRFGGEKALAELAGTTLLDRACEAGPPRRAGPCPRLRQAGATVGVNAAAGSPVAEAVTTQGLALVSDCAGSPAGPLSGVLAGLAWAKGLGASGLLTLPCDTPLLPEDLIDRLKAAAAEGGCAVARTPDGVQSLCAFWNLALKADLQVALSAGHPPVHSFLEAHGCRFVDYPDASGFLNVNTPQDLAEAERRLSAG